MQVTTMEGEYYLEGVREMASGFLFKAGGEFQFFFAYGALDRHGSGKWEKKDGRVILNSAAKPATDFTLIKSKAAPGDFITIKIEAPNPVLLRHVFCSINNGVEGSWMQMSGKGDVQFPKQKAETISLLLEFCPERFSTIPVTNPIHNEYVFCVEPIIMEVFFENFSLAIVAGGLKGHHPLMEGDQYSYTRQ